MQTTNSKHNKLNVQFIRRKQTIQSSCDPTNSTSSSSQIFKSKQPSSQQDLLGLCTQESIEGQDKEEQSVNNDRLLPPRLDSKPSIEWKVSDNSSSTDFEKPKISGNDDSQQKIKPIEFNRKTIFQQRAAHSTPSLLLPAQPQQQQSQNYPQKFLSRNGSSVFLDRPRQARLSSSKIQFTQSRQESFERFKEDDHQQLNNSLEESFVYDSALKVQTSPQSCSVNTQFQSRKSNTSNEHFKCKTTEKLPKKSMFLLEYQGKVNEDVEGEAKGTDRKLTSVRCFQDLINESYTSTKHNHAVDNNHLSRSGINNITSIQNIQNNKIQTENMIKDNDHISSSDTQSQGWWKGQASASDICYWTYCHLTRLPHTENYYVLFELKQELDKELRHQEKPKESQTETKIKSSSVIFQDALKNVQRKENLSAFCERGSPQDIEAIKIIIESDPKRYLRDPSNPEHLLNSRDSRGLTPLYVACRSGNKNVVQLLIENRCEPMAQSKLSNKETETPLEVALRWNHIDICKLLLERFQFEEDYLKQCMGITQNEILKKMLQFKLSKGRSSMCVCF